MAVATFAAGCSDGSGVDATASAGGGGANDDSGAAAPPSEDSPGIVDFDDFPVIGEDGYQGPDWLDSKMRVLLPRGLTITRDFQDPATGRAELTGFVTDGNIDELLGDARFMVRAGGYFPGEDTDSSTGEGFRAGAAGEELFVSVFDSGGGTLQWNMEFLASQPDSGSEAEAEAEAFDDLLDDAGVETGAGAAVSIGEVEWEISGGCEEGDFIGITDGVTLSVGFSEAGEPVGNFSDAGQGFFLLIPTTTPVTEYDSRPTGFSMSGELEGINWSIEVSCGG